jgi:glycosyltransferase involved in cell wall biosynthesis
MADLAAESSNRALVTSYSKRGRKEPLKILIIAEHASAVFGGEALIPYQYFKCLREIGTDVHLLVHKRTQKELYDAFPSDIGRLHFVADSLLNIWCHKIGRLMPDRLAVFTFGAVSHFETQIRQRRLARFLVHTYHFDIVHEPIPVSPKLPSMMFGLSVPVIIGPMNGGMDYPPNYDLAGPFERSIISVLRWTSAFWNRIMPGKRHAALILVANKRTFSALPSNLRRKWVLEFAENGVDLDRFCLESNRAKHENANIIYIGRLMDWKRVDLLIDACGELVGKLNFEVHIVGDGPMRPVLEEQVQRMSLTNHVRFHGRLPQSTAATLLRNSDIMVLPSMRECGGAVVLEAMACGVPVIATKWGGPADYIIADTGILIPPATPDVFVAQVANALLLIAKDPEVRVKMGKAGRHRVQVFYDWRMKARELLKIYENVVRVNITNATPVGAK